MGDITRIHPALHVLLAFDVLGILEPIRQNRRDVEPFTGVSVATNPWTRGQPILEFSPFFVFHYTLGFLYAVLHGLFFLLDPVLKRFSGPQASCVSIILSQADARHNFFSAVLILSAFVPLLDVADTVSNKGIEL